MPGTWSLERHEGCDGDLTLMLMPQQADRANLVVRREADGYHLTANQDDNYRELGCFGALDELLATVRANVRGRSLGAGPLRDAAEASGNRLPPRAQATESASSQSAVAGRDAACSTGALRLVSSRSI